MKSVWKFTLRVTDDQEIEMPVGAEILHVASQGDSACLWALVDTDAPKEKRRFLVHGTGHQVSDDVLASQHIGTFFIHGGALVFHVFEITPNRR